MGCQNTLQLWMLSVWQWITSEPILLFYIGFKFMAQQLLF